MKDIAIIGGGPAGAAAAIEARRLGLGVVLFERERFPRGKVCGEFLSVESLPLLEEHIPEVLARGAVIDRAEFIGRSGESHAFSLPRPARGLSRAAMDEALWQASGREGCELREGVSVRRAQKQAVTARGERHWILETQAGERVAARSLIVACGRWWALEGIPSPAAQVKSAGAGEWMGVKAHFRGVAGRSAVEMYYFRGGYCGLAPIENGLYNACCLVHRGRAGGRRVAGFCEWIGSVGRHSALNERLRRAAQEGKTLTTAPVRLARRASELDGALVAGDAAGFLDPFTGDGIAMALRSGGLAARTVAASLRQNEMRGNAGEMDPSGYGEAFARASARSYGIAGILRALVCAPEGVQHAAAAALPWLGVRLFNGTRWRGSEL